MQFCRTYMRCYSGRLSLVRPALRSQLVASAPSLHQQFSSCSSHSAEPQARPSTEDDAVILPESTLSSLSDLASPGELASDGFAINQSILQAKTCLRQGLDYEGIIIAPRRMDLNVERPWLLQPMPLLLANKKPPLTRLRYEIERFAQHARPQDTLAARRKRIIEVLQDQASKILHNHMLEVFGSEKSGLSLRTSDIDLRLVKKDAAGSADTLPPGPIERASVKLKLWDLYRYLNIRSSQYSNVEMRHARYPLISLVDAKSGIEVQIVCSNDSSHAQALMARYLEEYPYLRDLFICVKVAFEVRGLTDVFHGGFGAYSIFMMVVASLRHNPPAMPDAASGLISFLEFWSTFDTKSSGVSIEPLELFDKDKQPVMSDTARAKMEENNLENPKWLLCLRDPCDPTNDLGHKGASIKHVQCTFAHVLAELRSMLQNVDEHTSLISVLIGDQWPFNSAAKRRSVRVRKVKPHAGRHDRKRHEGHKEHRLQVEEPRVSTFYSEPRKIRYKAMSFDRKSNEAGSQASQKAGPKRHRGGNAFEA